MELKKAKEIINLFISGNIIDQLKCFGGDSLYDGETMENIMEAYDLIKPLLKND